MTELGLAEIPKSGVPTAVTVTVSVAVWESGPLMPVMVTEYSPGMEELKVVVEIPEPKIKLEGLRDAKSPVFGDTVVVRATSE